MPECEEPHDGRLCRRCRGRRARTAHKMSCAFGKHGGECDCYVTWEAAFRRAVVPIGHEYTDPASNHVFRVTDVGTRTIVVIDITQALADGYTLEELTGPPYSVHEQVWSEYDVGVPWYEPDGFRWEDPLPDPCTALHPHSAAYVERTGPCAQCGKAAQ